MPILGKDSGAGSGGISNIVEDTTPQLGGNLDINGKKIVSTSDGDIDIEPNGTGNVLLGNFEFDVDQTVGAGQDNYVLTYDNGTGHISLEDAGGDFSDGGDAGGAARSLGNTDNYDLHFLTNNTDRLHITNDGKLATGAETAPDCIAGGITLSAGTNASSFITVKRSDVAHGLTSIAETDTTNLFMSIGAGGGISMRTITETLGVGVCFDNRGYMADTADTTTSTGGRGGMEYQLYQHDGANNISSVAAAGNMVAFKNNGATQLIVKGDGDVEANGTVTSNSFDFAEYFESEDGQTISNGTTVVLVGDKIRPAVEGEIPFGVISATAAFIGNKGLDWRGRYERDNFGAILLDENGCPIETKEYDPKQEYISREKRPEWCVVGLIGQVYVRKGAPVNPNWIFMKSANEEADLYFIK